MFPIPEGLFPVTMLSPQTTSGAPASDFVSLQNAQMAWVDVSLTQAVGHATVFALERATAATSGNAVIANAVPIWYGNVTTATNALTRQTDAISYTMGGSVTGAVRIIFQVDPASLGSTYQFIGLTSTNSGQATNLISVTCWIQPRYSAPVANQLDYLA